MSVGLDIGAMTMIAVSDGLLDETISIVTNIDPAEARRLSGADEKGTVILPVFCFLVRHDGQLSLIDTGASDTMRKTLGQLPTNLRGLGVDPGDIDHILLTHLHPDHANGLLSPEGEAVFPRADVCVHAADAAFWLDTPLTQELPENRRRLMLKNRTVVAPYANRLRRVEDGEILPGISVMKCAGHSPGHAAWIVASGDVKVIAWGDIVHIANLQIPFPETGIIYDFDGAQAAATRRRVFEAVTAQNMIIAGAHLQQFSRLVKEGTGYALAPV